MNELISDRVLDFHEYQLSLLHTIRCISMILAIRIGKKQVDKLMYDCDRSTIECFVSVNVYDDTWLWKSIDLKYKHIGESNSDRLAMTYIIVDNDYAF